MWDIPSKVANSGATIAGKHLHSEFNNRQEELEKFITHVGIALTSYPADPNTTPDTNEEMMAEAASRAASLGIYATDSGAADAYVLSISGSVVAPKALVTGLRVRWKPDNTNTTSSTVNVFGLGAKAVRTYEDEDLSGGELIADRETSMTYDASANSASGAWVLDPWAQVNDDNHGFVTITSSTTFNPATYGIPTGKNILVMLWGGGGGGSSIQSSYGAGGAAGGFAAKITPAASISVTIGAGGAGNNFGVSGAAGGTTSWGGVFSAIGGSGGAAGPTAAGYGLGGDINMSGTQGEDILGPSTPTARGGAAPFFGHGLLNVTSFPYGSGGAAESATPTVYAGAPGLCVVIY